MKVSFQAASLLSLLVSLSIINNNDRMMAQAAKLRRGSAEQSDEIPEVSEVSDRHLLSVGELTDAELFALKKTPPKPLASSKCGQFPDSDGSTSVFRTLGMLRRYHPGCNIHFETEEDKGGLATLPPIGGPTPVIPTPQPTTAAPTTPLPTNAPTTPVPTAAPTVPLNCVQTVVGKELTIPPRRFFRQGEVHCLLDNETGAKAYFGYNWSNQFGLFVNGQAVWTAPEAATLASDRWTFQSDGNMLLRDARNQGMWRTHTSGNYNSVMVVSLEKVWIQSNTGSTLWFQPLVPVPTAPPLTDNDGNGNDQPTNPPQSNPPPPQDDYLVDNANCVQTVTGTRLVVPVGEEFNQGDLHCLLSEDGTTVAYFGYTWSNQFGLFVNGQSVWTIPSTLDSFGLWNFQIDGNLVIRDENRSNIWRSETPGNFNSQLVVSFTQVWIETSGGSTIWYQPPYPVTLTPTVPALPTASPTTSAPSGSPTMAPTTSEPSAAPSASPTTMHPTIPVTPNPTALNATPLPTTSPTTTAPTKAPTNSPLQDPTPRPTPPPTLVQHSGLTCVQTVTGDQLTIPEDTRYTFGQVHCLISPDGSQAAYFGHVSQTEFGLFANARVIWKAPQTLLENLERWNFQDDGNLVLRDRDGRSVWTSGSYGNFRTRLRISFEHVWIERGNGQAVWSQPPYLGPPRPVPEDGFPDPNGALQYYAYYYPWYHRNNWGRHGYQDEPLLGKYGTNEVAVAEQHIQWALETGITSWIVSYWGKNHLAMQHFKAGMINAPSINQIKFCMLYESVILDGRGSWRDGSKENSLYNDLKVIRDEFFDHPSYLRINGRPVIIFYITRSRMPFQNGFNAPKVLDNMRERLGVDVYFIADEPFFNPWNRNPDVNGNAFKDGKQVFDAYTTYNMYLDDRVRDGETATTYQLREGMPIWKRWAEKVPMFPNVMAQYYDFRGNKPLIGNADDFRKQLWEVACLPRTNFNGAPHIMFITSFNEWWEGTQIEPEDGSSGNWNNYGFQFMETLAEFKKLVDREGTYWCNTENPSASPTTSPPSASPTALPSVSPTDTFAPSGSPTMLSSESPSSIQTA